MTAIQKQTFNTVVRATGDEPEITISTMAQDRDGDEVDPRGVLLDNYRRNPVVLFGHDYGALPVGSTTALDVTPTGIRAKWRWLQGDEFADRVRNAFEQGVLRAASIGFRPIEMTPNGKGGLLFQKIDLLEWSLCGVPSNPEAVRQLKRLGLSERAYDRIVLQLDAEDDEECVLDVTDCDDDGVDEHELARALSEILPTLLAEAKAQRADEIRRIIADEVTAITGHLGGDAAAARAWSVGRRARR